MIYQTTSQSREIILWNTCDKLLRCASPLFKHELIESPSTYFPPLFYFPRLLLSMRSAEKNFSMSWNLLLLMWYEHSHYIIADYSAYFYIQLQHVFNYFYSGQQSMCSTPLLGYKLLLSFNTLIYFLLLLFTYSKPFLSCVCVCVSFHPTLKYKSNWRVFYQVLHIRSHSLLFSIFLSQYLYLLRHFFCSLN